MAARQNPTDHARTTYPRAGEWLKNSRDAIGIFLLAVGVVAMVVCLALAAHGSAGSALVAGGVAGLAGVTGGGWLFIEGRRVRRVEARLKS